MPPTVNSLRARLILGAILVVSFLVRVPLAFSSSHYFWADEQRFGIGLDVARLFSEHQWRAGADLLLGTSDHIFFRFIAVCIGFLSHCFYAEPSQAVYGLVLALFPVASVALIWVIVRHVTSSEPAAAWSALFYAGCVTAFFFGRHFLCYDPAICLLLVGWWIGLGGSKPFRAFAAGAVISLGYLTYNGYWSVGAVILSSLVLGTSVDVIIRVRFGIAAAIGLITPIAIIYGVAACLGHNLIAHARGFAQSVTQGDFGDGWRFLPSYIAVSERGYGLLLLVLAGLGVAGLFKARASAHWLLHAVIFAGLLIFFSDVVEKFVVYGRTAKPVMIFLALAAGPVAANIAAYRRFFGPLLAGVAIALAGLNFTTVLRVVFPDEFAVEADEVATTTLRHQPGSTLQMLHVGFFHRPPTHAALPPHTVLLRRPHPLEYLPYQYEGYDRAMRAAYAAEDISMRLIRLDDRPAWLANPPPSVGDYAPFAGVMALDLQLPEKRPAPGTIEPMVVSGRAGRGDLIGLRYLPDDRLQIVLDHWGWGLVSSPPFAANSAPGKTHRLLLSAGSLLPPTIHPFMRDHPTLAPLARRLVAEWDGQLVCSTEAPFYIVGRDQVVLGANFMGGSSTASAFTGRITTARTLDPRSIARVGWTPDLPEHSGEPWKGSPGPQAAALQWDPLREPLSGPVTLFAAAWQNSKFLITARPAVAGTIFSALFEGRTLLESAPILLEGSHHEFEFWAPFLMPPVSAVPPSESSPATWAAEHLVLLADGQLVFTRGGLAPEIARDFPRTSTNTEVSTAWGEAWPLGSNARPGPFPGRWLRYGAVRSRSLPVALQLGDRFRPGKESGVLAPLSLRIRFSGTPPGVAEPLVTTGRTGAGDVIFVVRNSDNQVRFGHDHWGWQPMLSPPVVCSTETEHTLVVSFGSLHSDEIDPLTGLQAGRPGKAGPLRILLDGQEVFAVTREFYRAEPSEVVIGRNPIGASSCIPAFSGEILSAGILPRMRL